MKKIAILLAGYDGEAYIHEQVFSILNQLSVDVDLYIRVDGDSELFYDIVKKISVDNINVHCIRGDIKSTSASNFYNLIMSIEHEAYDYFAFSDQDDIWKPDKLINAIGYFADSSPQGYSSAYTAIYRNGRVVNYSLGRLRKYDYFFQSAGPGCTFVINNHGFIFLKNFLSANKYLMSVTAHDWLIYYIFRINDFTWKLGEESTIYYRQHLNNVAGINRGLTAKLKRINFLFGGWYLHDILIMMRFAKKINRLPIFKNPFDLRRDSIDSILMWLYFWLFLKRKF